MFKLPDLPYPLDALEPAMSRDTLATHHGKHHAGYIKKTNAMLAERPDAPAQLEDVVRMAWREQAKPLFNNAAQAWNHAFFWHCLAPSQQRTEASGDLRAAIERAFGSFDAFKDEAKAKGEGHFASGWLWLVADPGGAVRLIDLHDADTPIKEAGATPLLVCDLWEHAYYLDYKNERGRFLDAFLNQLANWEFAQKQYAASCNSSVKGYAFPS